MKNKFLMLIVSIGIMMNLVSCKSVNNTMREPNVKVELYKSDFSLSDQVTGEARSLRIFGIDFARLFSKKTGTVDNGLIPFGVANLPIIGNVLQEATASYALYNMMESNAGYDVIFYPQYLTTTRKPVLGIGFIAKHTQVKVTARLGKLNK